MTLPKVVLPPSLLFLVPVLMILSTAPSLSMVMASDDSDDNTANIPDLSGQGQIQQQPDEDDDDNNGGPQCITAPCPTEPDGGRGGSPPPSTSTPPPTGSSSADANQVGGISAGDIIQRSNAQVTEQYCNTVAGIGDRRCQQEAPQGAIQDCTAIAGLGRANCVQSENPDGSGTCLTANGRPYICNTSTGTAISGSGQAGQ